MNLTAVSLPAKLFIRYMDDVCSARQLEIDNFLERASKLDPDHLEFTIEREQDPVLLFLDFTKMRAGFFVLRIDTTSPQTSASFYGRHWRR